MATRPSARWPLARRGGSTARAISQHTPGTAARPTQVGNITVRTALHGKPDTDSAGLAHCRPQQGSRLGRCRPTAPARAAAPQRHHPGAPYLVAPGLHATHHNGTFLQCHATLPSGQVLGKLAGKVRSESLRLMECLRTLRFACSAPARTAA